MTQQGKVQEALKAVTGSVAIRDRLLLTDPRNADWQRNLALGHAMIAQLHVQAGDHAAAASALRKALAVADAMLKARMHLGTTISRAKTQ